MAVAESVSLLPLQFGTKFDNLRQFLLDALAGQASQSRNSWEKALRECKLPQLKTLLSDIGLPLSGNKDVLVDRIMQSLDDSTDPGLREEDEVPFPEVLQQDQARYLLRYVLDLDQI